MMVEAAGSGQIWLIFALELSEFARGIHVKCEEKGRH